LSKKAKLTCCMRTSVCKSFESLAVTFVIKKFCTNSVCKSNHRSNTNPKIPSTVLLVHFCVCGTINNIASTMNIIRSTHISTITANASKNTPSKTNITLLNMLKNFFNNCDGLHGKNKHKLYRLS